MFLFSKHLIQAANNLSFGHNFHLIFSVFSTVVFKIYKYKVLMLVKDKSPRKVDMRVGLFQTYHFKPFVTNPGFHDPEKEAF